MESGTSPILWVVGWLVTLFFQFLLFIVYLWWRDRKSVSPVLRNLSAREREIVATEVHNRMAALNARRIRTPKAPRTPEEKAKKPEEVRRKGITFIAS